MWKHEESAVLEHSVSIENFVSIKNEHDWNYLQICNDFFIQNN